MKGDGSLEGFMDFRYYVNFFYVRPILREILLVNLRSLKFTSIYRRGYGRRID
jgi:hypothetical protein